MLTKDFLLFWISIGVAQAAFECAEEKSLPKDIEKLRLLYNGSQAAHTVPSCEFPLKIDNIEKVAGASKSHSIYKLKIGSSLECVWKTATFPDGAINFGIVGCQTDGTHWYIKKKQIEPAQFCAVESTPAPAVLDETGAYIDADSTTNLSENMGKIKFSKDNLKVISMSFKSTRGSTTGPFGRIKEFWSKLQNVATRGGLTFKTTFSDEQSQKKDEDEQALFILASDQKVPATYINAIHLAYSGLSGTHFGCRLIGGDYVISISHADKPINFGQFWKNFKQKPVKERLKVYLSMSVSVGILASYGLVHNDLTIDKWTMILSNYGFNQFECLKYVDEPISKCGRSFSQNVLRRQPNAKSIPFNDVYGLALSILNAEAGVADDLFLKDAQGKAVDLDELYAKNGAEAYNNHFGQIAKKVLGGETWGEVNEGFSSAVGANLSSFIYWIVTKCPTDFTVNDFRVYLSGLLQSMRRIVL